MQNPKKEFNLTKCPFCGKTRFTACPVNLGGDAPVYYVMCDFNRGGCGADSGWYKTLNGKFTGTSIEYKLVDKMDIGHPVPSHR